MNFSADYLLLVALRDNTNQMIMHIFFNVLSIPFLDAREAKRQYPLLYSETLKQPNSSETTRSHFQQITHLWRSTPPLLHNHQKKCPHPI